MPGGLIAHRDPRDGACAIFNIRGCKRQRGGTSDLLTHGNEEFIGLCVAAGINRVSVCVHNGERCLIRIVTLCPVANHHRAFGDSHIMGGGITARDGKALCRSVAEHQFDGVAVPAVTIGILQIERKLTAGEERDETRFGRIALFVTTVCEHLHSVGRVGFKANQGIGGGGHRGGLPLGSAFCFEFHNPRSFRSCRSPADKSGIDGNVRNRDQRRFRARR